MLRNHLKIARRNLWRHRGQFSLSAFSLFLGVTAFIIIIGYVQPLWMFDGFHSRAKSIVRLNTIVKLPEQTNEYAATSFVLGSDLSAYFPQIKSMVRLRTMPISLTIGDQVLDEGLTTFVDSTFLEVFSFPVIRGEASKVLDRPDGIVLSWAMAEKYFPNGDAVGQLIEATIFNESKTLVVTGVVENVPSNSSIQFDCLAPIALIADGYRTGYASLVPGHFTFFEMQDPAAIAQVSRALPAFVSERFPTQLREVIHLELQPLRTLYGRGNYQFDLGRKGNHSTLVGLALLGLVAMLVAVLNHINLMTTLGIRRSKEIAVRKVLGSSQMGIVMQYLMEGLLLSMAVIFMAGLMVLVLGSYLTAEFEMDLALSYLKGPLFWGRLFFTGLILTFLTSLYPAFFANRTPPVLSIKRKISNASTRFDLRKFLIPFQFASTIFFLGLAWVVIAQLNFVQQMDLGFNQQGVIEINVGDPMLTDRLTEIKQGLRSLASVEVVTASTSGINGAHAQATLICTQDSHSVQRLTDINYVDPGFLETYGVAILTGRDLSEEVPSDVGNALIINEAAAEAFGFEKSKYSVGQKMQKIARDTTSVTVIGVVQDYHSQSLYEDIEPLVWQMLPTAHQNILAVRLRASAAAAIPQVKEKWESLVSEVPFEFEFLDESIANSYQTDRQLSTFINIVSGILLFISCAGLYGMTLFVVEQRKSELGIRKILGASIQQLLIELNHQNLYFIVIAFVIAAPLSYYAAQQWLAQFSYRIPLTVIPFFGTLMICLTLVITSVASVTIKTARAHPIDAIREE